MRQATKRLFPGDRRVWLVAAALAAIGLVVIAVQLVLPRDYYVGTNSISALGFPTQIDNGQRLCVPDLEIPADTARLQIEVYSEHAPVPALEGSVESRGRRPATTRVPRASSAGRHKVEFAVPERSERTRATFCLRSAGFVAVGGMANVPPGERPTTVDGRVNFQRVAVWYLPPSGEQRSVLSQLPTIFDRAALFRPGWVGPWTYWILVFLWTPLAAYAGLRLLASAGDRSPRRTALALAAVAIANSAAWALIAPPFDSPDEAAHFAYVQWFAETGQRVARKPSPDRPPHSSEQTLVLNTTRLLAYNEDDDGRPPWRAADERRLEARIAAQPRDPPRDDGGGNAVATQLNDPLYYASVAPAYLATRQSSIFSQLTAARLLSALYGAIVVLCAFAVVREIVPRHPVAAVAAGLLVAFQPMFAFISGSVNNDNGVNATAAIVIYLTVRALRRGLTTRSAAALAVTLVALPVMKPTGYSLYPIVALALAGVLWRRHARSDLRAFGVLVMTFAAAFAAWKLTAPLFDQPPPRVQLPDNDIPITGIPGRHDIPGYLSYLWQVFLPPLPFMADLFLPRLPFYEIYVVRGFGAFGWYAVLFPDWVYVVIFTAMIAVAAAGIAAVRRHRDWARRHWMELAFVALVPFVVLAAVEAAFYTPLPRQLTAEFGRYEFPAMAALAALAAGACFGLGRRWAPVLAGGLVTAMIVLNYAAQLLMLAGRYT